LRHRPTKEAANGYAKPTATAPHLDSTDLRLSLTGQNPRFDWNPESLRETVVQPHLLGRPRDLLQSEPFRDVGNFLGTRTDALRELC